MIYLQYVQILAGMDKLVFPHTIVSLQFFMKRSLA